MWVPGLLGAPQSPGCPPHLALLDAGAAVQAQVDVAVVGEEALEDVEHPGHLGEDEDAVGPRLQAPQQHVQRLQLPWGGTPASPGATATREGGGDTPPPHPTPGFGMGWLRWGAWSWGRGVGTGGHGWGHGEINGVTLGDILGTWGHHQGHRDISGDIISDMGTSAGTRGHQGGHH